tara:strand:+ start:67 stop:465 length:399 start_codon:yes stop_codon:yes gene_type:complete
MKLEDYFRIIGKYELVDGVYNVYGDVLLIIDCEKLPVKFGIVTGHFDCSFNNLNSLEGCPISVGGDFYCYKNNLNSLEGSPRFVVGNFFCYKNNLNSLEGSPISVYGYFSCDEHLHNTKEYKKFKIIEKLRS